MGLLKVIDPRDYGFSRVVLWGSTRTLERIEARPWLVLKPEWLLDQALPMRLLWKRLVLPRRLAAESCDLLFCPGGLALSGFHPVVVMCRNMLPFDEHERSRYGTSATALRLRLLRWGQGRSFKTAEGVVFLTRFARQAVSETIGLPGDHTVIIPHGASEHVRMKPRPQRGLDVFSTEQPFRILYVSIVDVYKHQWHVAEAIAALRAEGLPVTLDLVGPAHGRPPLLHLRHTMMRLDPRGTFLRYRGAVPFEQLQPTYEQSDLFVFASSCENMPNILLEAMAAGLPIACSRRGPMPEILGDAGVYFDPEQPQEIAAAVGKLIRDPALRARCAAMAYEQARQYTWRTCAEQTFSFLQATCAQGRGPRTLQSETRAQES
jgi:glycosyltransferase involved in cell wall biosynthesis